MTATKSKQPRQNTAQPRPPDYKRLLTHLNYEVDMLAVVWVASGHILKKETSMITGEGPAYDSFRWALFNATVESSATHLRNLNDFLSGIGVKNDVLAQHFDPDPSWTPHEVLTNAEVERVNKEIAHLTYSRREDGDPRKQWPYMLAVKMLQAMERFYDAIKVPFPAVANEVLSDARTKGMVPPKT